MRACMVIMVSFVVEEMQSMDGSATANVDTGIISETCCVFLLS